MKVILIGFMGSGKTTYGSAAAAAAGMVFIDLDEVIVTEAGKSIPEIFAEKGEAHFRVLEHEALRRVMATAEEAIIATGGGAPCYFNNMELMNAAGTTVYLQHPPRILLQHLRETPGERPLIAGMDDEQLLEYITGELAGREPFYLQAQIILEWPEISPDKIIERIR